MNLTQSQRRLARISLVPMVDVLLTLVVFFMVTSTYLNLNAVNLSAARDQPMASNETGSIDKVAANLVLLKSNGFAFLRGQLITPASLAEMDDSVERTRFLILASPSARLQDLIGLYEMLMSAGISNIRMVRVEDAE